MSSESGLVSPDRIYPKVVVLCTDIDGSPIFHTCSPQVTHQQLLDGVHYDLAKENAGFNGFVEPMMAFDATDAAARQLGEICVWFRPG